MSGFLKCITALEFEILFTPVYNSYSYRLLSKGKLVNKRKFVTYFQIKFTITASNKLAAFREAALF